MLTPSQELRQMEADLMKKRREEETRQRRAEAVAIAAFKAAGGTLLTEEQLAGFLLPLLDAEKHKAAWERDGKAHLARLAAEAARPKQLVEIVFPNEAKGEKSRDEMRPLRWHAIRKCWEGVMALDDARRLARAVGGTLRVDGPDGLPLAAE